MEFAFIVSINSGDEKHHFFKFQSPTSWPIKCDGLNMSERVAADILQTADLAFQKTD